MRRLRKPSLPTLACCALRYSVWAVNTWFVSWCTMYLTALMPCCWLWFCESQIESGDDAEGEKSKSRANGMAVKERTRNRVAMACTTRRWMRLAKRVKPKRLTNEVTNSSR